MHISIRPQKQWKSNNKNERKNKRRSSWTVTRTLFRLLNVKGEDLSWLSICLLTWLFFRKYTVIDDDDETSEASETSETSPRSLKRVAREVPTSFSFTQIVLDNLARKCIINPQDRFDHRFGARFDWIKSVSHKVATELVYRLYEITKRIDDLALLNDDDDEVFTAFPFPSDNTTIRSSKESRRRGQSTIHCILPPYISTKGLLWEMLFVPMWVGSWVNSVTSFNNEANNGDWNNDNHEEMANMMMANGVRGVEYWHCIGTAIETCQHWESITATELSTETAEDIRKVDEMLEKDMKTCVGVMRSILTSPKQRQSKKKMVDKRLVDLYNRIEAINVWCSMNNIDVGGEIKPAFTNATFLQTTPLKLVYGQDAIKKAIQTTPLRIVCKQVAKDAAMQVMITGLEDVLLMKMQEIDVCAGL